MRAAVPLVFVAIAACGGERPAVVPPATRPSAPPPIEALLPRAPGPWSPSLVTIGPGARQPGESLADVDTCATCHADVTAQWQSSIHSFASFANPIYRGNIEVFRAQHGKVESQHCGGCHDLPLEIDGAMKRRDRRR
jgi:hypothetical protein